MDAAAKRRRSGKRCISKGKGSAAVRKEKSRLVRLVISVFLFAVVFLGRSSYPLRFEQLIAAIGADMDVSGAIHAVGQALRDGEGVGKAVLAFGAVLTGHHENDEKTADSIELSVQVVPLRDTGRFGLDYAVESGMIIYSGEKSEPIRDPSVNQTPEPTPAVVTAVAQVYGENGEALPSNVSFLYYELGLEQTVDPVQGKLTSGFGYRTSPTGGKREFHLAIDIAAEKGTAIAAFAAGTVRYIGESDEFGLYLMIDHANGVSTFYAHCSKLLVRKGEQVSCGQTVAFVGDTGAATGSHLHLTILKDNIRLDPSYYVQTS